MTYRTQKSREGVHINESIDSRLSKSIHTRVMVGSGVDMVDSNSVDAKGLHNSSVGGALSSIRKGVERN